MSRFKKSLYYQNDTEKVERQELPNIEKPYDAPNSLAYSDAKDRKRSFYNKHPLKFTDLTAH